MATAEYIGALISLVSKSDIRYQGLLASINPNEATIALERVRSWGTEGRRSAQGKSQEEIPPSDHVYDYIMFRAADVKDLKIDDPNPPKQQRPAPQPVLNDPAILNSSAQQLSGYVPPTGMYGMPPPPHFGAVPFAGAPGFNGPPPPQFNSAPGARPQQPSATVPPNNEAASIAPAPAPAPETAPTKSASASASPAAPSQPVTSNDQSSADKVLEEMSKLSVSKPGSSQQQAAASPSLLAPAVHGLPAIPHAAAAAANAAAQAERRTNHAARGGAREHRVHREVSGPSMPNREFDFESANAKFQKHKQAGTGGGEQDESTPSNSHVAGGLLDSIPPATGESGANFYDKKSGFFDNISSEIKERYERNDQPRGGQSYETSNGSFDTRGGRGAGGGRGASGRARANRAAEEIKNMQTFGDTGASTTPGATRARGRGSRAGFRGARGRGAPRGGAPNAYSNTAPMRIA